MGWLIAAGILLLLMLMPVVVRIVNDSEGLYAWLYLGPVKLRIYPSENKTPPAELIAEVANLSVAVASGNKTKEVSGGLFKELEFLLRVLWEVWGKVWRKLRITKFQLALTLAADDPGDLALSYGKAQIAVDNLMPQFERLFKIWKKDVRVYCDFLAQDTRVYVKLDIMVTFTRLIILICQYLRSSYRHLNTMNF